MVRKGSSSIDYQHYIFDKGQVGSLSLFKVIAAACKTKVHSQWLVAIRKAHFAQV